MYKGVGIRYFQISEYLLNKMDLFVDNKYLKQYGIVRILSKDQYELMCGDINEKEEEG